MIFAERKGFFLRCAAKATKVDCEPIGVLAACLSVKTKKNTARVLFLVFAERKGFFLRCAAKATKVDCEPIGVLAACLSVKTKKNTARVLFLVFAERKGFEPLEVLSLNGFQDRRNRPLCHLSMTCLAKCAGGKCGAKLRTTFQLCNFLPPKSNPQSDFGC